MRRAISVFLCVSLVFFCAYAIADDSGELPVQPKPASEESQKPTYFRIPIKGAIGRFTTARVKTLLKQAAKLKPTVVILDLDTPGGSTAQAEEIIDLIIKAKNLRFVAFVHEALSAGAAITLACPEIYMSDTATMGAATSYWASASGMPLVLPPGLAEKSQSHWRAVCRKAAQHGGHASILADAMIDPDFALTMRKENGRIVLKRDGRGKTLKAKGRILTLTPSEAVSCGLAKGFVQDLPALGRSLSMSGWSEIKPSQIYIGTRAKRRGSQIELYERMREKANALKLNSKLSTTLQKETSLNEWNGWLKKQRIIGQTIELEVGLIGVDEERAKSQIAQINRRIASVESSRDSVRRTEPLQTRDWRGTAIRNPDRQRKLNRLRSERTQYVKERGHITSHPFDMYGHALEDFRVLISARVSKSSREFLGRATIGTDMLLSGRITEVTPFRLEGDEFVFLLELDYCKAGPSELSKAELIRIAQLSTPELAKMLKTGDEPHAYAALRRFKADGGLEKHFYFLLSVARTKRGDMIVEGLMKPVKTTASDKEKRMVDKFLDFLGSQLKTNKPSVSPQQAIRSMAQAVYLAPDIRSQWHPVQHSSLSDLNEPDPSQLPVPYANDRVVSILTQCLNSKDRKIRETTIHWLAEVGPNDLSKAEEIVAVLEAQALKEDGLNETEEVKEAMKKQAQDSIKRLKQAISDSRGADLPP